MDTPPSAHEDKNQQGELDVNLEEYKRLSNEILKRVEIQQMLLNYQIVFVGIIITAGLSLLNNAPNNTLLVRYFLLLSPLPFYFLSWSFSNHDLMIVALARYINTDLRPRIIKLIGSKDVLRFEDFLRRERDRRAKEFGNFPILGEEYLLPLVFPIVLIALYIIFSYTDLLKITKNEIVYFMPQLVLLGINLFVLILTIRLKVKAGRNYTMIVKEDPK